MKKTFTLLLLIFSLSVSAQSQITWSMGMNIASSASGNQHPRVATDAAGNPLVLWGNANRAMFSRWNGSAFTAPVMINPMTIPVAHGNWMGPDIASHGDTVYVVFKQTPEGDSTSHVYIIRSFNGGMSFSPATRIDFIGDSISRFPTVTTDASGNPIVGFMKFNSSFLESRWVVAKSSDFGNTFSADVKASGWSSISSTVCDCCPGSITSSGSKVAVPYRDNNANMRDIWAGISSDGGSTFTQGLAVDQGFWLVMSCPASGPDAAIINDTLYTVYMSASAGPTFVWMSKTSLLSMTASTGAALTGMFTGLSGQNYPRIAADGNALAIVWEQTVNSTVQLPLFFTNNINSGLPAAYDTVDLNDITNADVALANGKIFVVWEDDNSGTVKYRKGSYNVSTSVPSLENNFSFAVQQNPVAGNILKIQFSDFLNAKAEYTITNLLGQDLIHSAAGVQSKKMNINISSLAPGTYFLTIISGNKSFVSKIIRL